MKKADEFIHESITGSQFIGRIEEETTIGGKRAIVPSIESWVIITGYNTIIIGDDACTHGFPGDIIFYYGT